MLHLLVESIHYFILYQTHIVLRISLIMTISLLCFSKLGAEKQIATKKKQKTMKYNPLTKAEEYVIIHKGTERPFTGKYLANKVSGTYICKRCNTPLYYSKDKFDSRCGWPSFDDEVPNAVKRLPDADGRRVEIVCNNCEAHLGHVFVNEGFTDKETRHCVNSISLNFIPDKDADLVTVYFASGCFWGTEFYFMKATGVLETAVGFMGGKLENPSYEEVCTKNTGHLEVTEITYNTAETTYEELVKLFFETHDFSQADGQGPDIGSQYLSCIFYTTPEQKQMAEKYIQKLKKRGYEVATMLKPATRFWKAEDYHQQYYQHKGAKPYCHKYKKIF